MALREVRHELPFPDMSKKSLKDDPNRTFILHLIPESKKNMGIFHAFMWVMNPIPT